MASIGLCTESEYRYIGELISQSTPCNILVFSLGHDSTTWVTLNPLGNTTFIEHDSKYIELYPHLEVVPVEYTTTLTQWRYIINKVDKLSLNLPPYITDVEWDIIFIDGPQGHSSTSPGRMQSIYTASTLTYKHILVHDCHRKVEQVYFNKYIGTPTTIVDTLYHYYNI